MARKKRQDAAPPGAPLWMVTYSDMITQVLAFFIMLFSFSSVNEQKFAQAIASLQGAFGVLPAADSLIGFPFQAGVGDGKSDPSIPLSLIEQDIRAALKEEKADQQVRIEPREGALVLHFDAASLFDSGRAEIKPVAYPGLDAVADVLKKSGNRIRIEGHTDSDPMIPTPQFPDNWALSSGRARMVLLYFTSQHAIAERRLQAAFFADTLPVAPNDTPDGKARNRRVDIIILK